MWHYGERQKQTAPQIRSSPDSHSVIVEYGHTRLASLYLAAQVRSILINYIGSIGNCHSHWNGICVPPRWTKMRLRV